MKNKIQELIKEMEDEISMATWQLKLLKGFDYTSEIQIEAGIHAIEKWIQKLTQILNEETVAASEDIDFCTDVVNSIAKVPGC